jgi:hypothetical protein
VLPGLGALLLALAACAPTIGWERDTARVCAAESPAVICIQTVPDRGVVFDVGGAQLVPGECAHAPEGGGALRVAWTDGEGRDHEQRIRAARARRTVVALEADGELRVVAKIACDPAMPPFAPIE